MQWFEWLCTSRMRVWVCFYLCGLIDIRNNDLLIVWSSRLKVFLRKGALKNMQQIYLRKPMPNLLSIFIENTLRHGCSSVNLRHIFRTPFLKNTCGRLFLKSVIRKMPRKFQKIFENVFFGKSVVNWKFWWICEVHFIVIKNNSNNN